MAEKKEWDQLEGEPNESYTRFLFYLQMGPTRSINTAYRAWASTAKKSIKSGKHASGQWAEDSTKYHWRERASRWDVEQLLSTVPETASIVFKSILGFAKITLESIESGKHKPANWQQVQESLSVIASLVSPAVIAAAVDNSTNPGDETAPGPGPDPGSGGG